MNVQGQDPDDGDMGFEDAVNEGAAEQVDRDGSPLASKNDGLHWFHNGGFLLIRWCWRFFIGNPGPEKTHNKDSRFKYIAERLINNIGNSDKRFVVNTTRELLKQHRTIEDTEARRRLEKWACRTIIIYLISVLVLVVLNGLSRILWPDIFKAEGFISDAVMYVILSTTTINIIGLGVIVLQGHFPTGRKGRKDRN